MPGKISILKENGEVLNSNVVSIFTIPETEKKYIIMTENTVDPHGLTVLHVSEIVDDTLARIATNEEWDAIKTIMRTVISGGVGSYTYLPLIDQVRVNGQYSRDISVSAASTKQMMDAYALWLQQSVGASSAVPVNPTTNQGAQVPIGVQPAPVLNSQVQAPQMVAQPMGPQQMGVQPVPVAMGPAPTPSSIFPEGNVVPTEENEISPGIAEIGGSNVANSMSNPVLATAEAAVPIAPSIGSPADVTATVEPVMPISITPVMEPSVQQPMAMPYQADAQVQPVMGMDNQMSQTYPAAAPVVPQAQIVQPADNNISEIPSISLNFNATPNFAPNATLDEVVSGSQEIFMESVRNLVQSMTEKVYRDLYQKEAMLKERENLLNEREKMLNNQMMSMMNNFGAQSAMVSAPQMMQQVPQMQPMQQMPQVVQPMTQMPQQSQMQMQPGMPMSPIPPMVGNVQITPISNVNPDQA